MTKGHKELKGCLRGTVYMVKATMPVKAFCCRDLLLESLIREEAMIYYAWYESNRSYALAPVKDFHTYTYIVYPLRHKCKASVRAEQHALHRQVV